MLFIIFLYFVRVSSLDLDQPKNCSDRSPYCNKNDCIMRPGYALEYCERTCGDCKENFMADALRINDDPENTFYNRKLDQPNQMMRPRAMSIFNQGKPSVVKQGPLSPLGTPKTPFEGNYYQSPYVYPPQTPPNMGYQQFGSYPDPRRFQQSQVPRPIHADYEDSFIENNVKMSKPFGNPEYLQPMPNQQQIRPLNYLKSRRVAMKQARPYTVTSPPFDYDFPEPSIDEILEQAQLNEEIPPLPTDENTRKSVIPASLAIADLITLLGCRDKDPVICSHVTEESCRARPGFYLKLCPVKCKNCNGLICMDSNKIDCHEVLKRGGCRLPIAGEYCPKSCNMCQTPNFITEQQSPCRDELDTCEQLSESGACEHPLSRNTLRHFCAKSCRFCKNSQYFLNEFSEYVSPSRHPKLRRRLYP